MNLSYLAPLQRAWARMVRMLFRPFSLETWLTLGFAAFLAELIPGGHSHGFSMSRDTGRREQFHRVLEKIGDFFSNPLHLALVVFLGATILVVVLALTWLTSRGRFILLDNVAHERTGIAEPWRKFARIGNSLFFWRVGFWFVVGLLLCAITIPFLSMLGFHAWLEPAQFPLAALIALPIFLMIMLPLGLAAAFIGMLMRDFVEPLMYRYQIGASEAWKRLIPLLRDHFGSFLLYGLFVFVLTIVVSVATVLTCCGFGTLVIPYVGSVVFLPVTLTYRALGPEFLGQFGPDFAALQAPRIVTPPAPPAAPPTA